MSENIFAKFNKMIDVDDLKQDIEFAASNTGEFVEVPKGDYEVKISKLELGESKKGMPMAKVWFTVLAGDFKNQKIFMNQMLTTGFGIHKMNEFLNSLETGVPVVFENFEQYADLLNQIFAEVDGKAEYQLAYGENKGFGTYTIVQRF